MGFPGVDRTSFRVESLFAESDEKVGNPDDAEQASAVSRTLVQPPRNGVRLPPEPLHRQKALDIASGKMTLHGPAGASADTG